MRQYDPLILASASPRRSALLEGMGLLFTVDAAAVCEDSAGPPESQVLCLAQRKAMAVAQRHPEALILGADTLVFCEKTLGKPQNKQEAAEMLRMLSGRWHEVYTGLCLLAPFQGRCDTLSVCTAVHFVTLDEKCIKAYVDSGEPMDKAGAYGIQGRAGMWIDRIEGSYTNVVGLPTSAVRDMLLPYGYGL